MAQQVQQSRSQSAEKQVATMRTVLFMAKEDISDVKFQALVELQQLNDCSVLQGDTYRHHTVLTEMEECIASSIINKRREEVEHSPFVGILINETVNITVNKKLIVFLRYVRDESPHMVFLGNYTIPTGDAGTVYNKVREVLEEEEINAQRVIGLGSDGASVMFGRHNGVGVRMSAESPHLLHMHCIAHRVALVTSNASKDIEAICQFRRTVNGVYNLFEYSAARYARLRELHKAMEPSDFKSLKEPCSVIWLSLTRAVDSIHSNWPSLVLYLEEERVRGNATAAGLLAQIKSFKFVAIMHMLLDVLPILESLSRCFQEENVSIGTIKPRVTGVRERLTVLKDELGEKEHQFMEEEFSDAEHTYNDQTLLFTAPVNVQVYRNICRNFIEELISNLGNGFPEEDLDVLSALSTIFEVRKYPMADRALRDYGNEALQPLSERFGQIALPENLENQFLQFKYIMHARGPMMFPVTCKTLLLEYKDTFPSFAVLANISLAIPVSSVNCECGFSVQNCIKTSMRTRLNDEHVDDLMLITMEGPLLPGADDLLHMACQEFSLLKTRKKF